MRRPIGTDRSIKTNEAGIQSIVLDTKRSQVQIYRDRDML